MRRVKWLAILLLLAGSAPAADLFDIKPVVQGVYAAIAKPQYIGNCNAAIIVLSDGVLVVDTHSKPSAARALIEQIKQLTDKPVKYVVDTHFHSDHYQGNQAYPSAWPAGLEIISSEATREDIERRGIPRMKRTLVDLPKQIDGLKAELANRTDAARKTQLEDNLRQAEDYLAEVKTMQATLPSITFDRSLILYDKSRIVEILWLGKAHTDGDVFVYLPKEKVLASGDALLASMPFMGDSYPYDWIKTLEKVERLDFAYAVGGHGDVMQGKGQLEILKQYLTDLMAETAEAYAQGASMAEAQKIVADKLRPRYAENFPAGVFDRGVGGNIQKAYRVISGAQQ